MPLTFFTYGTHAERLRITSTPPGAKVEINGVAVGTTPFEKAYPGGYFSQKQNRSRLAPRPPAQRVIFREQMYFVLTQLDMRRRIRADSPNINCVPPE
jgi:PEGA domain